MLLATILTAVLAVPDSAEADHAERMCSSAFAEIDRLFSELISIIRDPNDPRFQDNIDKMYNCCLSENFTYVLNGHPVSGRDNIAAAVQQQVNLYTFRWTHPPVPHIYPNGFYDRTDRTSLAKLTSIIIHTFTNSTGTYTQFGNHFFYCQGDIIDDKYRMINATLTNFAVVKS